MSIDVVSVQKIRLFVESPSEFGVDKTTSLSSFEALPIHEGSAQMTLDETPQDPKHLVQSRLEGRKMVRGPRKGTLGFTLNLAPTGVPAASGTFAQTGSTGKLLSASLGGCWVGSGSLFTTGSTAQIVNLVGRGGGGFAVGSALGWVNASGILETQEIYSKSGDTIYLKHSFSGTPSSTQTAYACATYYPTEDPVRSLQVAVEGYDSNDRFVLLGGQAVGGITFAVDPTSMDIPSMQFSMEFADWKAKNESTGSLTGSWSDADYSYYNPISGKAGELRVWQVGSGSRTTGSLVHASAITFAPKVMFVPVPSPNGKNGIYRWRGGRTMPPVEGSFTTFYENPDWFDIRNSRDDKEFQHQIGVAPGNAVVLSAPTIQITNPQKAAAGEIDAQTIQWQGRRDTVATGSSDELAKAPYRIHVF